MKNVFKTATLVATLSLSTVAVISCSPQQQPTNENDRIGFADPNYLMQNHPWMQEANQKFTQFMKDNEQKFAEEDKKLQEEEKALVAEREKLEDDAKKLQKEQTTIEASLKKKVEALEKEAPRLRSRDIQARQDSINAEYKAFQNKVVALQKREEAFGKKADAFSKKIADFKDKVAKAQQNSAGFDPNTVQKQIVDEINETIKKVADSKGYTLVFSPAVALYAKNEKADITEEILELIKSNAKPLPVNSTEPAPTTGESKSESSLPEEVKK